MAYEHKDGSGALFKNDKGENLARPDYKGDLMVGGKMYRISAWIKDGQKGKFMSLKAEPKEAKEIKNPKIEDADIPF
jgi:hypothetical protein